MTFGSPTDADFILYDDIGDRNLQRDQGQLLLKETAFPNSRGFGIVVDAGSRDTQGQNSTPHPGPVRNLLELDTTRQVPGVVISNNVIFGSQQGAIHYSGESCRRTRKSDRCHSVES